MKRWAKAAIFAYIALDFLTPAGPFPLFLADSMGAAKAAVSPTPTNQFPTTGWQAYAPGTVQCGELLGANFNVTTDQAIYLTVPTQYYHLDSIEVTNASVSLTTAAGGIYTATAKGGTAVVGSGQAYSTLTAAAVNAAGSTLLLTLNSTDTTYWNVSPLYLSLTTAQGAAATADVRVRCKPLYR